MKLALLSVWLALPLLAQPIGPWASADQAPHWWLAIHAPALWIGEREMAAQIATGTFTPKAADSFLGPTVSFSPQGSAALETMTGKRIKGVGIHELVICSPTGVPVQGGAVYQLAVKQGISPISPRLAGSLITRTVQRNWRNKALNYGGAATLALPVLGQAGVISMTSRFVVALLGGHLFFDDISGQLRANLPDPAPLLDSLLQPDSVLAFAGTCHESTMVTRYTSKNPVSGTFPLQ